MSIRPIDMSPILQKNQEVHQAKQTVVSKLDNELVQAQLRTKEDVVKKTHTVNQFERSETRKVKNDNENDEDRKNKHKKNFSKHQNEELESIDDIEQARQIAKENLKKNSTVAGSHFDMKV